MSERMGGVKGKLTEWYCEGHVPKTERPRRGQSCVAQRPVDRLLGRFRSRKAPSRSLCPSLRGFEGFLSPPRIRLALSSQLDSAYHLAIGAPISECSIAERKRILPPKRAAISMVRMSRRLSSVEGLDWRTRVMYVLRSIVRFGLSLTWDPR